MPFQMFHALPTQTISGSVFWSKVSYCEPKLRLYIDYVQPVSIQPHVLKLELLVLLLLQLSLVQLDSII